MPVMTLDDARQMQADDVALDDAAVAQAERDADEAEQAAATLENSAITGGEGSAAPAAVLEARAVAEFARSRAVRVRQRAERARAARRLLDLAATGDEIDAIAAAVTERRQSLTAALKQIAAGHKALTEAAAVHDRRVSAAIERTRELQAERVTLEGHPHATSAHVASSRGTSAGSIAQHRGTVVRVVGADTVAAAAQLAAAGRTDEALAMITRAATHVIAGIA